MAAVFSITFDTKPFQQFAARLGQRFPSAMARALNRTATSERAAMATAVAKDLGIKVGVAREGMRIEKAIPTRLSARVIATGKRIPLYDLNARGPVPSRGRGRGVSYVMRGTRKRLPNAFIARMPSGHLGVFERTPGKFMRAQKATWTKPREAIHEKFGVSIAVSFQHLIPLGEARREEVLLKNVQHELEFALSKVGA